MNVQYLNALSTTMMHLIDQNQNAFHFANSFRGKQIESKQWLVNKIGFSPKNILILGSWYGTVLPVLLKEKFDVDSIDCVDSDGSVLIGAEIFTELMGYDYVKHYTQDAKNYLSVYGVDDYDLVINTSCEHMPFDMKDVIESGPVYALESNNYYGIDGHVNCKDSLAEFEKSTGLSNVFVSEEKDMENYTRYLVIGTC